MNNAHFPEVRGKNLEGTNLRLPQDLEGELNLVFLAFQREQQLMVNTWLPTADLLESLHPELRYYELPTISRMNPLARWFINTGMRSGIKDPKSRRKTITLYLDKGPFRKALGLATEDNIYVLLVDRQGKVLWESKGPCNAESAKNLSDSVQSYFAT
jgi:hypothetical protein